MIRLISRKQKWQYFPISQKKSNSRLCPQLLRVASAICIKMGNNWWLHTWPVYVVRMLNYSGNKIVRLTANFHLSQTIPTKKKLEKVEHIQRWTKVAMVCFTSAQQLHGSSHFKLGPNGAGALVGYWWWPTSGMPFSVWTIGATLPALRWKPRPKGSCSLDPSLWRVWANVEHCLRRHESSAQRDTDLCHCFCSFEPGRASLLWPRSGLLPSLQLNYSS